MHKLLLMAKIVPLKNGSKKDVINKKAAVLFRKKGFAASSMRELAESMGIEAPSLYNHIGSKSEILQNICFKVADDFFSHLQMTEKLNVPAIKKIESLIRFHINIMLINFDEIYVANHEWKQLKEPYLADFLSSRRTYENKLVSFIKEGIKNKELKNIHPQIAALTILSSVRGLEFWQRYKKSLSTKDLENNMVDHLLNGLIK